MKSLLKLLGLRLVALSCAVLLWFYATLNRKYETTITIPIRLVHVQENLAASDPFPENAKVLVSGTGRQLFMLKFYDAELLIAGDKVLSGPNTFKVNPENVEIRGNPGVRVLLVKDPPQFTIHFDAIVNKDVPLLADLNVVTAQDWIVMGEPRISPDRVMLTGPRCNVAQVETLRTQHAEISGLSGDTGFFSFVRRPDLVNIEISPNKVRIAIEAKRVERRRIDSIPIKLIDLPEGSEAKLNVSTVSLVIAGAGAEIRAIRRDNINVYVSCSRFTIEQQEEAEPTVTILGNVQWSNLEPKTVRLVKGK